MTAAVELSVVVPVRDGAATIGAQLDALVGQRWAGAWEVVVVDNGSRDGTVEVAEAYAREHPRVRVETVVGVGGAGAVRNAGAELARGTALAFCDADDVVAPGWVAAMGDGLRAHDAVTGPLEVETLNAAWLVRTRGTPAPDRAGTFHGCFPVLPAGNFGIRTAAWQRVGGFDPVVVANEDTDLSLRLWQQGIGVHFDPAALVHYRYRDEARVLFAQGLRYGTYRALVARGRALRVSPESRASRAGGRG